MNPERPLFIVGAPRSGTTLLLYMLRSHPRLFLPGDESHFFIPLYRRYGPQPALDNVERIQNLLQAMQKLRPVFFREFVEAGDPQLAGLAQTLAAQHPADLAGLIDALYRHLARRAGKVRWGDKTPYYVQHLDTIDALFPDCQVVHLIRDGRDVALSMLARRHDFDVYNIYHAARYWEECVEAGRRSGRRLGSERYLELRYEDLLAAPQPQLERLCGFLHEPYSEEILEFERPEQMDSKLLRTTPLVSRGLQQANVEKWRERMKPRQIATFERAVPALLREYHYPLTTAAPPLPLPLRAGYRLHNRVRKWLNRTFHQRPVARL
ncbi:sulfotransferase family protein [Thiohalobacter thiocyanaticus]|uniref:Sulfotransferase n=1 Tax=Thiohalobacter thiocyanaticus TaxID=585455 RepID=A0A426QM64_9GAMM|nr:sulfotransferase [Thiohalobacter thiocyanaticus]RRQ22850.1 sulfotransferase [Thiohalobacter thiocyanaticus]